MRHDRPSCGTGFQPVRQRDRLETCPARVVFFLLLLLAVGCGRHGKSAPTGGSTVPPSQTRLKRNVELGQVRQEKIVSYVETVGYLEAEGQTEVHAGVSGLVEEVRFREGQYVKKGDVLILIDQARYKALVAQAEANVARMEAAELRAEENLKKRQAELDRNRALLAQGEQANRVTPNAVSEDKMILMRGDVSVSQAEVGIASKEGQAAVGERKAAEAR